MTIKITTTALAALGLCLATSAFAQEPATAPEASASASVMRQEDASMTCIQIGDEAARLSETMGGDPDSSWFGALGGVARSGATMLIPGAGLVMAGADVLTRPESERREAEAAAVRHRWYYLNGLYAGLRCHAQSQATAAAAATTPATTVVVTPTVAVNPAVIVNTE